MKLFINRRQRIRTIIGNPIMVLILLAVVPYGSFDPREIWFWGVIFQSLLAVFLTLLAMKKYHIPDSDKKDK